MRTLISAVRNFLCVLSCSWLSLAPVWADDTEIFFADVSEGETSPNILFIVDTSGSMGNTVSATGKTRMQSLQDALRDILNNLFDVNVGLMRFSNPGGPVLYQVDYIDRSVNETEAGLIDVVATLSDNDDDAQEVIGTGQVIADDTQLALNLLTVGSTGSWTERINDGDNDSEEEIWNDRCSENDSTYLEMTHNDSSRQLQAVGLRFGSVGVPLNATISNAYITFTVVNVDAGGLAEIDITAEARDGGGFDDRGSYCDNSEKDNITGRTKSASTVEWNLNQNLAAEQTIVTPAITTLVQEIVDHADWSGDSSVEENDMVFIFERRSGSTTTGRYDFYARDGSSSRAPQLHIEYYLGSPPSDYAAKTGLRFQSVNIPKGVIITHATIDFTVAQADAAEVTSLVIYGEDDDEPAAYSSAITGDISNRNRTSASVNWTAATWDTVNTTQSTPNITSIVQEIVSRADWCGGDDMAFVIEGTGLRNAYARDAANGYQPVLNIQYAEDSVVAGSSCMESTLTRAIIASPDDAEEDGGSVSTTSAQLNVSGTVKVGFRFTDINLPEEAPIRSAYLEFYSADDDGGTLQAEVRVQLTGDAEAFSRHSTIDDRAWSSAVSWTDSEYRSNNERFRTPNIGSLVQTIVARDDWTLGNDIAFLVDRTSGDDRDIESYDGSAARAAKLIVTFEDDGTETEIRLVRDELIDVIDSLNTQGYTPIQDTLYEAALYLRGDDVDYGAYRGGPNDSGPHSYTRVSVADSMVPGTYAINRPDGCTADHLGASACGGETISGVGGNAQYKTPIDDFCQKSNHVILLTDGQANRPHSETRIKTMAGVASCLTTFEDSSGNAVAVQPGEECVLDLVSYLNSADQSGLKETQTITTHSIGFNFSSPWLEALAKYGGGVYREATNALDLVTEIQSILEEVLQTDNTFVAPVVSIDQFNRLNHRSEIYFAVFRPNDEPGWPGNLKKYRLRVADNVIIDYEGDGKEAVSSSTGFFKDDARSAWSTSNDGAEVEAGGAFGQLPDYSSRNVYVSYSGMTESNLSHASNQLTTTNNALLKSMFGVDNLSDSEFDAHIEWIRGKDVDETYPGSLPSGSPNGITAENRYSLGDPLHSRPAAVTYGGSEESPDITVFYGTNAGFLHAVDSVTGVERFAFLPEDLFTLQAALRENSHSTEHLYGIDGNITVWVEDVNGNGTISGDDFARIFFGMRRGGRNYYGLDVSDRDAPELMWTIKGGQGDFVELAQSWAQPRYGKLDLNGTVTDVLYLSGGYDSDQDDSILRVADDVGRAMYIVNAATGALIWSGGDGAGFTEDYADMLYSIPATPTVIDGNSDGLDDTLFVGDMGGQVWRFDIHNGEDTNDLVSGGVIADLGVAGGSNTPANNRRFYHRPDPAFVEGDNGRELVLTIGSGYRAHPLDMSAQDRFYLIRQTDAAPDTYTKLTESNLYNSTDNEVGEGSTSATAALAAAAGWYFDLPGAGEKALSIPLITDNTVIFMTYEPGWSAVADNCIPSAGASRVYQVSLEDSSPVNQWDSVDGYTEDDRSLLLQTGSIVDRPVKICTEGAGCNVFIGSEMVPLEGDGSRSEKIFWRIQD